MAGRDPDTRSPMTTVTDRDTKLSSMATARQTARRRMLVHAAVVALRPQEWIKNSVVLAPVLFAGQIDGRTIGHAVLAFAGFCRSEERRVGKGRRYWRDWSSDVCSSDLGHRPRH